MSFLSGVWDWFTGSSITSTLAKTALLGYASQLLNKTTSSDKSDLPAAVDPGVRLQLNPSTENKIPVLYGEAYFSGNITDLEVTSDYKKARFVVTLAELTGTKYSDSTASSYTFREVYLNGNRVVFKSDGVTVDYTVDSGSNQDINMRDLIKIYFYAGSPTQPDGYGGTTPAASTIMSSWGALTHPMSNLMYAIVEITYSQANGINGLPECVFHVENDMHLPGDVIYDYMTNNSYGAGIESSTINTDTITALNTYGSTGFTYTDASGTPGQSGVIDINGLVDTATPCLRNIEELADAVNAWVSYDIHEGVWGLTINKAGSSVASFSNSNIVGEIKVSGTSMTQLHNAVDVKYQNTDIRDKTDYVKIEIDSGDLFDNEPRTTLNLSLPYTNKQAVAIKVGLIALKQARVDKIITFRSDFSFINVKAGEIIDVTASELNMTAKKFRVITTKEVEGNDGEIFVEFTALEYFDSVYDYNIEEFEVETDDGLYSIGAIGQPDVPIVTKFEQVNLPRVVIEADVPSGVVDRMEFWLTYDTGIPDDVNRSYFLIGSTSSATTYTENETVSYTYNSLTAADFYIKVRGANALAVGPYSDPTGLIEFQPVVVADTISDEPVSFGGQLMSLGILTLLNNLDDLLAIFNGDKSIFDAIKELFFPGSDPATDTVADLLAADPNFLSNLPAGPPGPQGPPGADGVGSTLNSLTDVSAPNPRINDQLYWDGEKWVAKSACAVTCTDGSGNEVVDCGFDNDPCQYTMAYYPNSKNAQTIGYLYMTLEATEDVKGIKQGSGSARLYKSDGTLVDTVTAEESSWSPAQVGLPFTNRATGTDYYVLMDEGFFVTCPNLCSAPGICSPNVWNFTTGPVGRFVLASEVPAGGPGCNPPKTPDWEEGDPGGDTCPERMDAANVVVNGNGQGEVSFLYSDPANYELYPEAHVAVLYENPFLFYGGDIQLKDCSNNLLRTYRNCKSSNGEAKGTEGLMAFFTKEFDGPYPMTATVDPLGGSLEFVITGLPMDSCFQFILPTGFISSPVTSVQIVTPQNPAKPQAYSGTPAAIPDDQGNIEVKFAHPVTFTGASGNVSIIKRSTGTVEGSYASGSPNLSIDNNPVNLTGYQLLNSLNDTEYGEIGVTTDFVGTHTTIELIFDEKITVGSGNFYLRNAGGTIIQTFDVNATFESVGVYRTIVIDGSRVILNPTTDLDTSTTYYVTADSGAIKTVLGYNWGGISANTDVRFTTDNAPYVASSLPVGVSQVNTTNIQLDFDKNVVPGGGYAHIYRKSDDQLMGSYQSTSDNVS